MKSIKTTPIAAVALALLTMAACKQSDITQNTITFENLSKSSAYKLEGSAGEFGRDSDLVWFDSVSMIIPERLYSHDVKPLRDTILNIAFDTIAAPDEAIRHFSESLISDNGYTPREIAVNDSVENVAEGLTYINGNVVALSGCWMTYCVSRSVSVPGAAHGLTTNRYITYALDKGEILTLDDIFTAEGLKELPRIIRSQAARLVNVLGPTDITAIPADGNFLINDDGSIVFAYQPYEVACYAQGEIKVPFYPYQLSEYMTPRGLSLFHLYTDASTED